MLNKKRKILIVGILVLGVFIYVFTPKVESYFRWKIAAEAAGGFPITSGISKAVVKNCYTSGTPPICYGYLPAPISSPCNIIDPVDCLLYSEVSGVSAGGTLTDPNAAPLLLSNIAMGKAGLTAGGQLIYGGTTQLMYPAGASNSVLASAGGCFGCLAQIDTKSKIKKWFYNFIIAGERK